MATSFQISNKFNNFNMEEEVTKFLEEQLTWDNEYKIKFCEEQVYESILTSFKFLKKISSQEPYQVWLCLNKVSRTKEIVKVLNKINLSDNQLFHAQYHTIAVQTIQSSKTVKISKIQTSQKFDFYIMEFCCRGDLIDFMTVYQENNTFQVVKKIAFDAALGLRDIHSQGFVYRDMKPENVGVDHLGNGKILDFGLVVPTGLVDPYFCGTVQYMPPERLQKSSLSKPLQTSFDCWSFGIFLYELFHGQLPYSSERPQDLLDEIYEHTVIFDPEFPQSGKQLIQNLLETNPKKRLTMDQVVQHQFFKIEREMLNNRNTNFQQTLQIVPCQCQDQKNFIESQ